MVDRRPPGTGRPHLGAYGGLRRPCPNRPPVRHPVAYAALGAVGRRDGQRTARPMLPAVEGPTGTPDQQNCTKRYVPLVRRYSRWSDIRVIAEPAPRRHPLRRAGDERR